MTQGISEASINHEELLLLIKRQYVRPQRVKWFGILVIICALLAGVYLVMSTKTHISISGYVGIAIGLLSLAFIAFIGLLLIGRLAESLMPTKIGSTYINQCINYLKDYDDIALDEEYRYAEVEQGTLQANALLPNIVWAGVIATFAFIEKIDWKTWAGLSIIFLVFMFILAVIFGSLMNVERSYANIIIIKSVFRLQSQRLRSKNIDRDECLLEHLLHI